MPDHDQTVNLNKDTPRYCNQCGAPLIDGAAFCGRCGTPISGRPGGAAQNGYAQQPYNPSQYNGAPGSYGQNPYGEQDQPSVGFNILAFFIPIVGLILYLVWKDQYPRKAKSVGQWALISFIIGMILTFFTYALAFFAMAL